MTNAAHCNLLEFFLLLLTAQCISYNNCYNTYATVTTTVLLVTTQLEFFLLLLTAQCISYNTVIQCISYITVH